MKQQSQARAQKQQGFILVTVLFVMVIVIVMMTTTSMLSLSARKTTGIESRNIQAFHAAQAGLDRARLYAATAVDTAPSTITTAPDLAQWLAQQVSSGLSSSLDSGRYNVTITANTNSAGSFDGTVTLTSTGYGPNDRSTVVLEQQATTSITQYNAPFKTPAALTASGNVTLRGNDPVTGYELPGIPPETSPFTCVKQGNRCKQENGTYTLNGNFTNYNVSDFVEINGGLFRVETINTSKTSMTIRPVGTPPDFPEGSITKAGPILTSSYAAAASSNLSINASPEQATGFLLDYASRVAAWEALGVPQATLKALAPTEKQWAGYVRTVNSSSTATNPFQETATNGVNSVTVANNPALAQYTKLQRIIPSIVTLNDPSNPNAGSITSDGTNAVPETGAVKESFTAATLFGKIFSSPDPANPAQQVPMTKQQFYDQATKISFDEFAASSSYYCGKVVWVGNPPGVITPPNTNRSVTMNCPPSNPATVVVNNEGATFDIGTQTAYNGLLYVIADSLAKQGNGCINGAVVVESTRSPAPVADLRGTACPGGEQHDGFIKYDPAVLNTLGSYNTTPQRNFDMASESWRQVKLQ